MDLYLLANIIVWGSSLLVFIIGCLMFMRPEKPLFAKMITLAIGCACYGRFYEIVRTMMTDQKYINDFHLGLLGVIGSIVFFFTANRGVIDKVVGGDAKENMRCRLLSHIAPAIVAAPFAFAVYRFHIRPVNIVFGGLLTVAMVLSSYYSFKHLIMPDSGDGTLDSMRMYNVVVLIYTLLCILEMFALISRNLKANLFVCIAISIVILLFIPIAVRGNKKWRT